MPAGPGDGQLALPVGTRLVHIGPHKTGTTSLQEALFAARPKLLEQGVRHIGTSRNPATAVQAVTGRPGFYTTETPPIGHWRDLVEEFDRAHEARVILSSEFFAWAAPDAIRRIVDDLDPERVRVAVTLRPLGRIMPSHWQQDIQAGFTAAFDEWLDLLLRRPEGRTHKFWTLHRHEELIRRWCDAVGPDRMTVVVADDRDHTVVLRAFERLTGLREGTLVPDPDRANRSLTLPEAEALRAFNVAFREKGYGRPMYARVVRFGAAKLMKARQPAPDEPRVEMPQWAIDRAAEIGREFVTEIQALGVRVIGDLDSLARVEASRRVGDEPQAAEVPPDVVATLAMGILEATGATRRTWIGPFSSEPLELAGIPTGQIARLIAGRARKKVRRIATAPLRRLGR
jgi:hypothetical protein